MTTESDFEKLLLDAPMAPDADTVTLAGALERTVDAKQFGLRLPDGRSVTLDISAVKSAKKIAGAVGQLLVQLELDAKLVPEGLRNDAGFAGIVPKAPVADVNAKILRDPVKHIGEVIDPYTGVDPALLVPFWLASSTKPHPPRSPHCP